MGIVVGILALVVIIVGVIVLKVITTMDKLDMKARDAGSEIDGNLWDRNHRLNGVIDKLDELKIDHGIRKNKQDGMALGMAPTLQQMQCKDLDEKDKDLKNVIAEHKELESNDEFQALVKRFDEARMDLIKSSLLYNRCASDYNGYISGFPASFLAERKRKGMKEFFNYVFTSEENKN